MVINPENIRQIGRIIGMVVTIVAEVIIIVAKKRPMV